VEIQRFNGAENQRPSMFYEDQQSVGFVSATGFRLSPQENQTRALPANSWISKFVLPANATSYGASKLDPVFVSTYNFLSRELTHMGNTGQAFTAPTLDSASGREVIAGYKLAH
jgi:hypothetical protein